MEMGQSLTLAPSTQDKVVPKTGNWESTPEVKMIPAKIDTKVCLHGGRIPSLHLQVGCWTQSIALRIAKSISHKEDYNSPARRKKVRHHLETNNKQASKQARSGAVLSAQRKEFCRIHYEIMTIQPNEWNQTGKINWLLFEHNMARDSHFWAAEYCFCNQTNDCFLILLPGITYILDTNWP